MKKVRVMMAIDPDCDKSGVAVLNMITKKLDLYNLPFPVLIDFITDLQLLVPDSMVVVEAGWLNDAHWHLGKGDSRRLSASKGNAVGRNHETGRKIVEMCRHFGVHVEEVRPLRKIWSGTDRKITHDEIARFIPGIGSRTNQEVRDAALLAWHYAGFPIVVKPIQKRAKCSK